MRIYGIVAAKAYIYRVFRVLCYKNFENDPELTSGKQDIYFVFFKRGKLTFVLIFFTRHSIFEIFHGRPRFGA